MVTSKYGYFPRKYGYFLMSCPSIQVFEDRYRSFTDPDIPSFYYGSHYSSMGIVLFYLLRLEPFTTLHHNLQGGKFDHADRLFQSVESTYKNCLTNASDVKDELPEFFYMPEFLVNSNSYHLGVKQDGEPLGDVCLPPWAQGSPEEFIQKNREALESEYVSSNLHHWIDLIFGYKQRGKPAVQAVNIFYYLTYEGVVDLEHMEDDWQGGDFSKRDGTGGESIYGGKFAASPIIKDLVVAKYGKPIGLDEKLKVDLIVIGSIDRNAKAGSIILGAESR